MPFEYNPAKSQRNLDKHGSEIKAEELDQVFDTRENVLEFFDLSTAERPGLETKRLGVPRQMVIKVWLAERLATSS